MDQPLVNLNIYPNSIDQTNPEIQRNIYIQENQFQSNQQNIDLPPVQPFYLSSQIENTSTLYEKPIKSQQNQENPSSQSTLLIPAQNYTQSKKNVQTDYPSSNEGVFKAQPVYNIENHKYNKFSKISHKGITHPNENTFNLSTGCCAKCFPSSICFIGLLLMSLPIIYKSIDLIVIALMGLCISLCGLIICFNLYTNIYFIMGQNNLKVEQKYFCSKKTLIYNQGELLRIDFIYESSPCNGNKPPYHDYRLDIILKNGSPVQVLSVGGVCSVFTQEEINYFLYIINTHIQTKM